MIIRDPELTRDDVSSAYRKLKSLAYFDSYDLFLKARIAEFETRSRFTFGTDQKDIFNVKAEQIEDRLDAFFKYLTSDADNNDVEKYWSSLLAQIDYKILPKKVNTDGNVSDGKSHTLFESIFTNERELEQYDLEKIAFFFDGPVEIYLLTILWIMKLGFRLEEDLDERCYGNRLILEKPKANSAERQVVKDEGLFKPYFKQYQKWRDEGIAAAQHFLDDKQNVLFINLDIKDYYYSVRVDSEQLRTRLAVKNHPQLQRLHDLFERVNFHYTNEIKKLNYPNDLILNCSVGQFILPIGLPSSYILANWYLRTFDLRVRQHIRPIYYSRYVDDIFIILAQDIDEAQENCTELSQEFGSYYTSQLNEIPNREVEILRKLYPVIVSVRTPKELEHQIQHKYLFKLSCFDNLYVQPSKTLVYEFKHDSSLALLDKFKHDLEKRSSEFRFLPVEKMSELNFDDEAYELVYEDSMHKVKTLKDYRENRYGISAHLSKNIFYSLRSGEKSSDNDVDKIMRFFKGTINLEFHRQWERLFTYLVINDRKKEFVDFSVRTLEQLFTLPKHEHGTFKDFAKVDYVKITSDLLEYFSISMEMALALDPQFIESIREKVEKIFNRFYSDFNHSNDRILKFAANWSLFRASNLIRHNYVLTPLLNYTQMDGESLLTVDIAKKSTEQLQFSESRLKYSPRKILFAEAAIMTAIQRINSTSQHTNVLGSADDRLYASSSCEPSDDTFLDDAFEKYFSVNYRHKLGDVRFKTEIKERIFRYAPLGPSTAEQINGSKSVQAHEILVGHDSGSDQLNHIFTVGLANMKVEEENYRQSMLGAPNMKKRYSDLAPILNMAEKEKCNMIVLPELAVPYNLIGTLLDYSVDHQRAVVTGLEHWTHDTVAFNFILTILPITIHGRKDAVPVFRLKNHYSPLETFWIQEYRKSVPIPHPYRYHLYRWRGVYFSVYYCFELADIYHRSLFRSKVDFLISSEWNKDTPYFSNIAEATSRDIHCYFVQVNTSQYGDSRVTKPSSSSHRDSVRIKGGTNTTLLVDKLYIQELRNFQYKGFGLQKDDDTFKPTPADYNHEDAKVRMQNQSFSTNV